MATIDFGIQIEPQFGFTYPMIRAIARAAEAKGFESLWVSDHFFMTPEARDVPALECWTTIAALATETKTLRLGPMVAAQSFRNPALAAKIAASLDHISGGRIYYGIGAGWKKVEYQAYGYPFPRFAHRIVELEETIEIAKRMWREDAPTFEGEHYRIAGAVCFPKPAREGIPIWVGGQGDRSLAIAARHADGINFAWSDPPEFYRERYATLDRLCEREGRDPSAIRRSAGLMMTIAPTEPELARKLEAQARRQDVYMNYVRAQQQNFVGTPAVIVEKMREYVALGVDHFIVRFQFGEELEMIDLFAEEVMSQLA